MSQIIRVGLKDGKKYHILGICDEAIIMNRYIKKNSDAIKKEVVRLEETYPEAVVVVGYEYTLGYHLCKELFCEGIKTVIFTKEYDDLESLTKDILNTNHEIYIPKDQVEGALGLFQVADQYLASIEKSKQEIKKMLGVHGYYKADEDLLKQAHEHEDIMAIAEELAWIEGHLEHLDEINRTLLKQSV